MKICVISTPIFKLYANGGVRGYAGLEQLAWLQAKGLAELGHDVSLIAPDGSECPGVTIIPMGPERGIDERNSYDRYWKLLPNFDVIIDNSWNKWTYILKQEGVLKAPVLGVLHAPVNTMYQSLPPVDKPCFVCISQDQANHFQALFSKDVRWAWNGADVNFYKHTGVPRTDRFLFLARFSSIKGADLAIQACREAGVGLDLVGDTSITNEPEYFENCKKMCDGKKIKIIGGVSRGETVHWFSQAHCMLHPNQRFREPLGLAPVEAQMSCCPVIAWDYGAMRETIAHGETGFLVNSVEEMIKLIKTNAVDSIDRNRCRERAVELFSIEKMISRYEQLCIEAKDGGW